MLLGSGPTDLWGLADAVDPALLVAVDWAVADDAGADDGPLPDALLARGALDADPAAEFEPPHAASSSTSDPIPVAAAHPLYLLKGARALTVTGNGQGGVWHVVPLSASDIRT